MSSDLERREPLQRRKFDANTISSENSMGGATPFQLYQVSRYAMVPECDRPQASDFLMMDPKTTRQAWRECCPPELEIDLTTDSAEDILDKIRTKNLGGTRIVNAHSATSTDLLVRSHHQQLAQPEIKIEVTNAIDVEKRLCEIEKMEGVRGVLPEGVPSGSKIVSTVNGKLTLGQKPWLLGERTARIYSMGENIPQLDSPASETT